MTSSRKGKTMKRRTTNGRRQKRIQYNLCFSVNTENIFRTFAPIRREHTQCSQSRRTTDTRYQPKTISFYWTRSKVVVVASGCCCLRI